MYMYNVHVHVFCLHVHVYNNHSACDSMSKLIDYLHVHVRVYIYNVHVHVIMYILYISSIVPTFPEDVRTDEKVLVAITRTASCVLS